MLFKRKFEYLLEHFGRLSMFLVYLQNMVLDDIFHDTMQHFVTHITAEEFYERKNLNLRQEVARVSTRKSLNDGYARSSH